MEIREDGEEYAGKRYKIREGKKKGKKSLMAMRQRNELRQLPGFRPTTSWRKKLVDAIPKTR